jgi:O-antigen/teichoic acid export membrane protein
MLRKVASLFVANAISFALVGASYLVYSRVLRPDEFGIYTTALAIGTLGQQVLDAGIRNTIIKSRTAVDEESQGTLLSFMIAVSALLIAALALGRGPVTHWYPRVDDAYVFLAVFGAIYLASYPFISLPTARLERALRYERIAWVESTGQVLEKAMPAALLALGFGMPAFLVGLAAGRALKIAVLTLSGGVRPRLPTPARLRRAASHLGEGLVFRAGVGISMVRDNLHVLILGPLFGTAWVGYYGWALQLGQVASQAFVQTSARVSLPVFAQTPDGERRWRGCVRQTALLAGLTGPLLAAALVLSPSVNVALFHGRWTPAIALLPLLLARQIPNMATTPASNLVLVEGGARAYTLTMLAWTVCEVVVLVALLPVLGPAAMAASYATSIWLGLYAICWPLAATHAGRLARFLTLARALVLRPGILGPAAAAMLLVLAQPWLAASWTGHGVALLAAVAMVLGAYAAEPDVRDAAGRLLVRGMGRAPAPDRERVGTL